MNRGSGSSMAKPKGGNMTMDWLISNRETAIRQKELKRTLARRAKAIKQMDEEFTSKEIASKLINSTFNMKLPE